MILSYEKEKIMTAVLIITILVALVVGDALYLWYRRSGEKVGLTRAFAAVGLPQGILLHQGHSWALPSVDGRVKIGLDEFLSQSVGNFDRVDLPLIGSEVEQGSTIATVWRHEKAMNIPAPISGTVQAVNLALTSSSLHLSNDPYGAGWLAFLTPVDMQESFRGLRAGAEAKTWMQRETGRFVDFMARRLRGGVVGMVLPDGAHPVVGAASELQESDWRAFASGFAGGYEGECAS